MNKTLILGVGNYLLSDDGLSIHVLQHLNQNYTLPEEIEIVDGGTCGLDLLRFLEGVQNLIIIDAVNMEKEAGTIIRLDGDDVPAYLSLKISPHDIGLPDLLATAKLRDLYPENIVVFGVQPASLALSLELSPSVAAQVGPLARLIVDEVTRILQREPG